MKWNLIQVFDGELWLLIDLDDAYKTVFLWILTYQQPCLSFDVKNGKVLMNIV